MLESSVSAINIKISIGVIYFYPVINEVDLYI